MLVWYQVRDLESARDFYTKKLGFTETFFDEGGNWAKLERNGTEVGLAQGEPEGEGGVAHIDVEDVKGLADELRGSGVDVGVVLELHDQIRLLDVFDPDGNRLQFAQELSA